jgi:cellulose synthase/poly-beta-1,6-N-acetylglucosamine synthase-like glycosyltransferase
LAELGGVVEKSPVLKGVLMVGIVAFLAFVTYAGFQSYSLTFAEGRDDSGLDSFAVTTDQPENSQEDAVLSDPLDLVTGIVEDIAANLGLQDGGIANQQFYTYTPWLAISSAAGVIAVVLLLRSKNSELKSGSQNLMTGCLREMKQENSTSHSPPNGKHKRKKRSGKNRGWIAMYIILVLLWGIVFVTTIRSWMVGTEALVDAVDISYFTLPLLVFNLVFVGATFLIFAAYFRYYTRSVKEQEQAKVIYGKLLPSENHSVTNGIILKHDFGSLIQDHNDLCSIIIPARNEENVIGNTIVNCLRQTHQSIEIVVVCHNCSDDTYGRARSVTDSRVRAFELDTKEAGKGIALNFGVEMAKGKYLLILDGDGKLNDSFVEDALPLFAAQDYAAVQGRYIPSNRNYNFITRMLSLEGDLWSTPFMTFRTIGTKRTPLGGTGYIIRRDALLRVGGFANHLVDDYELTFRLLRQGYRIAFAPRCINYDEKPAKLEIMLNQRARWLKGFFNLTKSRVAEPSDIVGNLYWVNPLTAFTGLAFLLLAAYSTLHYIAFLYYPFHYSYIPLTLWIGLTLSTFGLYTSALVMQYGRAGFGYAAWLPIYLPFANYYMVVALKAFFVKSWAETKTAHGFVTQDTRVAPRVAVGEKRG